MIIFCGGNTLADQECVCVCVLLRMYLCLYLCVCICHGWESELTHQPLPLQPRVRMRPRQQTSVSQIPALILIDGALSFVLQPGELVGRFPIRTCGPLGPLWHSAPRSNHSRAWDIPVPEHGWRQKNGLSRKKACANRRCKILRHCPREGPHTHKQGVGGGAYKL